MTRSRQFRLTMLLLAVVVLVLPTAASAGGPPPTQGVRITPIGSPTWKPVDFHLFSAPLGTADTGYAEFAETALGLMPEPNHAFHPDLLVGPGDPHDPPYGAEMAAGVAAQGYHEGVRFSRAEFSEGMGVWTSWVNVPHPGTTGSSPDYASGPIIANSLFPIHVEAFSTRNNSPFSTVFVGDVPALNAVTPPFAVDGTSHFPFFLADNADFGPTGLPQRGSYTWRITMVDASGNGWQVRVHFTIAP